MALLVIGYIGVFFGNLIKAAVSRQREFLADASAVQFTRNPAGIAGALKKIGGLGAGSGIANEHAAQTSHFYFARGIDASLFNVFATHPPLEERVRRLEPGFSGEFPEVPGDFLAPLDEETPVVGRRARAERGAAPSRHRGRGGRRPRRHPHRGRDQLRRLAPRRAPAGARAGRPGREGARAVLLAMLLDRRPEVRASQRQVIEDAEGATAAAAVAELLPLLDRLDPRLRLPLADVAAASLRSLEPAAAARFAAEVEALVAADGRITLAELMLATMVGRRLRPILGPPDHGVARGAAGGRSPGRAPSS